MHEELAVSERIDVEDAALFVGTDVDPRCPQLSVLDTAVRILQIDRAGADAFDFGAGEGDARFVRFIDKIVVTRFSVLRDKLFSAFFRHDLLLSP